MFKNRIHLLAWTAAMLALVQISGTTYAGDIGHYNGGVMNIRDFRLPDPGFYVVLYNSFYFSKKLNDANGNQVKSFVIGNQTIGVNVDLNAYALAPGFIWVTEIQPLGLRYGIFVLPTFSNSELSVDLTSAYGNPSFGSKAKFGVGDMFVGPLWLAKSVPHWDLALSYGFYAPIGKYNTKTVTVPQLGPRTFEASDNIGFGFWTHQIQGIVSWSTLNQGTFAVLAGTFEMNAKKKDFDLTPGNVFTLNYGISQFLPLNQDQTALLELGPAGYNTWQVTGDKGSIAGSTLDQVHAIGGQLGLTYTPWKAALKVNAYFSYSATDRPQGTTLGVTIAKAF